LAPFAARLYALVVLSVVVVVACAPSVETASYDVAVFPSVAHSGFNPKAKFQVVFSTGGRDPKWAVDDPSVATIAPSPRPTIAGTNVSGLEFARVTVMKAGETNIRMTSGGATVVAKLMVKAYTDEQLAIGEARYTKASSDAARAPCASCHRQEGGVGVDHSPLKMAGFDDPEIIGIVEAATYPLSPTGQSTTSAFAPKGPLKFTGHKEPQCGRARRDPGVSTLAPPRRPLTERSEASAALRKERAARVSPKV
jgi:mono/diheme cytochrome c family protein